MMRGRRRWVSVVLAFPAGICLRNVAVLWALAALVALARDAVWDLVFAI